MYRRKAIQLLGETFSEATAVLVLDRELEIVDSHTSSFMELGLRIECSGWAKRLWTLQEVALASDSHVHEGNGKLYFQMRDGPFLYQKYDRNRKSARRATDDTTELMSEERSLLFDFHVMLGMGSLIPSVRSLRDEKPSLSRFMLIYKAVEHRSTSKVEDVPVCIASLVALDVSKILSAPTIDQRMANFYLMMREIPSSVLWCEYKVTTQRLSMSPFRWALSTITDSPYSLYKRTPIGICDTEGLHVQYRGFIFEDEENAEEEAFREEMLTRECTIRSLETGAELLLRPVRRERSRHIPLQRDMALIFREPEDMDYPPNTLVVIIERKMKRAENGEMEFYATIVGQMHASKSMRTHEAVFRGTVTNPNQRWCIT